MSNAAAVECEELLFAATVPVSVSLCPADVTAASPPLPLFFNVPRASLLCALWGPISDAFQPYVADFGTAMPLWVDSAAAAPLPDGTVAPLPWHVPIGAIVDELASTRAASTSAASAPHQPLRLVAHTTPAPKSVTPPWPITKARDVTILTQQRLKQSLMAMFGDLKPFYKAPTEHINAIVRYSLALSAKARLVDKAGHDEAVQAMDRLGHSICSAEGRGLRVPVNIYRGGKVTMVAVALPSPPKPLDPGPGFSHPPADSDSSAAGSPPATPLGNASALMSVHIGCVIAAALPVSEARESRLLRGCVNSDGSIDFAYPFEADQDDDAAADAGRYLVGGLAMPMNVPLGWALQHLAYADKALHITVVPANK